jgi:hypothetical protein
MQGLPPRDSQLERISLTNSVKCVKVVISEYATSEPIIFLALARHNETMAQAMGRDHKTGKSLIP